MVQGDCEAYYPNYTNVRQCNEGQVCGFLKLDFSQATYDIADWTLRSSVFIKEWRTCMSEKGCERYFDQDMVRKFLADKRVSKILCDKCEGDLCNKPGRLAAPGFIPNLLVLIIAALLYFIF
ncbi:hypothetical protein ILUMI_24184 [Ignelater luminosus]|uniref:Uncharacterized protein n=1 Tax=Ignelater luminosus TaxID=2038154 RepID=A0A8K0CCH4_IGNLU|nr:hypothetical protein ILUMI_24184 [Ignelater luminosus]